MSNNELSIVDNVVKNTIKKELLAKYNGNTVIRSLVQIVPFGSIVDLALTNSYNNILIERAKCFYDELNSGTVELTTEIIESEEFLHAYFSTFKAALFTKQREKIRFFARLFKSGLPSGQLSKADEYDDYLKILDELTFREIYFLFTLKEIEKETGGFHNDAKINHWKQFEETVYRDIKITPDELKALVVRMVRTGCFMEQHAFVGGSHGGYTTVVFDKLYSLIKLKDEDLIFYRKL
ncbi:hypothetical protein V7138_15025 [Bacillus sp. JJ1533]|uniref:hypothetical protein n=1 Tax=Bacillus sp. JJ1533 TaxID=3122959 RepID=UPI002FFE457B